MKHLFTPYCIKGLGLRNRIVMPAIASFLTKEGGEIPALAVEHYRRRAAGGPAMVMMEACAVSPEGIVSPNQSRIDNDWCIEGLAKIARAIEQEGSIPAIQIHHGGRQISPHVIGRRPLAPSPLPCPAIRAEVEPLTIDGIQQLVQRFADAAVRATAAGYRLIEIHGAHGYLVNQFLSRFSNIRKDAYGGDVAGRTRFARTIVEEIRRRLGQAFPLSFKISAQEFVPDGLTVPESIEILKLLIEAGIDIVQVSAGNDATPEWISQPMLMGKACLADSAGEIKKALNIPVMVVGRINDPIVADEIIATGKADLVCIARGLLADPELPLKAKAGQLEDIRTCIACNTCMQSIFRKGQVECLVNPSLGRESEMAIHPAKVAKRVLVAGGGPAGLNLAWVAAKRGHTVHLFEKTPALGGQLFAGSFPNHKKEIRNLIRFLRRQAEKFGVKFHINHEATLDTIHGIRPDVVIVATGSVPIPPPFPVECQDLLVSLDAVLNGGCPAIQKTIIVGGGATGCELALHIADSGSPVTLVEMLPKVGMGLEAMTRKVLFQRLGTLNVRILTETKVLKVSKSGVWILDRDRIERHIETERVVMAIGFRSDPRLYDQIKAHGYEVHRIGDCVKPRNAQAAIYEAALLARMI